MQPPAEICFQKPLIPNSAPQFLKLPSASKADALLRKKGKFQDPLTTPGQTHPGQISHHHTYGAGLSIFGHCLHIPKHISNTMRTKSMCTSMLTLSGISRYAHISRYVFRGITNVKQPPPTPPTGNKAFSF